MGLWATAALRRSSWAVIVAAMAIFGAACGSADAPSSQTTTAAADANPCDLPAIVSQPALTSDLAKQRIAAAQLDDVYPSVDVAVDDTTFSQLADEQIMLAIAPDAAAPDDPSRAQVIAATPATRAWLNDGTNRARAEQVVRTIMTRLDDLGEPWGINGIALANSARGMQASIAAASISSGTLSGLLTDADRELVVQTVMAVTPLIEGASAVYHTDTRWIIAAPDVADVLRRSIDDSGPIADDDMREVAYILRHEMEHAVTPEGVLTHLIDQGTFGGHSDVEEGMASTLARWPGSVNEMLSDLGQAQLKIDGDVAYDDLYAAPDSYGDNVAAVRELITAAGFEANDVAATDQVRELLQGREVQWIARAVAATRMPEDATRADCDELTNALTSAGIDTAAIRKVVTTDD